MSYPVRHCPFCGEVPALREEQFDEGTEFVITHRDTTCIASAAFVMAATPEQAAEAWNARAGQEYSIGSALDPVVHALLHGKPDTALRILRKAINGDCGSDEQAWQDYWQGWLTEVPITQVAPTVDERTRQTDLFAQIPL